MFSARGCVPVSSLGSVRGNTVPRDSIDPYTSGGRDVLDIMITVDHFIQYHSCCQWIQTNTSLQWDEY